MGREKVRDLLDFLCWDQYIIIMNDTRVKAIINSPDTLENQEVDFFVQAEQSCYDFRKTRPQWRSQEVWKWIEAKKDFYNQLLLKHDRKNKSNIHWHQ